MLLVSAVIGQPDRAIGYLLAVFLEMSEVRSGFSVIAPLDRTGAVFRVYTRFDQKPPTAITALSWNIVHLQTFKKLNI